VISTYYLENNVYLFYLVNVENIRKMASYKQPNGSLLLAKTRMKFRNLFWE